jgi:hypothetical protein
MNRNSMKHYPLILGASYGKSVIEPEDKGFPMKEFFSLG